MTNNEKRIKLTTEQYRELKIAERELRILDSTTLSMIKALAQEKAKQDEEFWEQVFALAGVPMYSAQIKICWISQEIVIIPEKDDQ